MLAVEPDTDAGEIKPVKLPKHALPDGDKPMLRCAACDVDVDIQNVGCLKCHGGLTTDFRLHKTAGVTALKCDCPRGPNGTGPVLWPQSAVCRCGTPMPFNFQLDPMA